MLAARALDSLQGMTGGAHLPVERTAAPFAVRRA